MFLHRWQLDTLIEALGPHAGSFDLDAWVQNLDQQQTTVVLPAQRWAWVQHQLALEVTRRGLPVGNEPREHWTERCPHTPRCGNGTNCDNLVAIDHYRKRRA